MFPVDVRAQSGKEVPKVNCGLAIEDWMQHIQDWLVTGLRLEDLLAWVPKLGLRKVSPQACFLFWIAATISGVAQARLRLGSG